MAIIDLASYLTYAGLPSSTPLAPQITAVCAAADADVKKFCKRALETASYTEYRNGSTVAELALYQRPVYFYLMTGTLLSGQATITGLSSTSNLLVGMPVCVQGPPASSGTSPIPPQTTILNINSSSQVTMAANATANASNLALVFGVDTYMDAGGYGGQGNGAFAANTQLFLGTDYMVVNDGGKNVSNSGMIRRMGGGPSGSPLSWPYGYEARSSTLTARRAPIWANWYGNVLCCYTAGLGTGSSLSGGTLPADLSLAAAMIVSSILRNIKSGGSLTSESLQSYSYTLTLPKPGEPPEFGTARQILGRYRELAL